MDNQLNRTFLSIEDFVWNEDFRTWVLSDNQELNEYWNNWMAKHPEKSEDVAVARQMVRSMSVKEVAVSDQEMEYSVRHILSQLDKPGIEKIPWFRYAAVAASLLVVFGAVLFIATRKPIVTSSPVAAVSPAMEERTNTGAAPKRLLLADGSKVTLFANAGIRFAQAFPDSRARTVYLTGKATFEVAKDASKPFLVYSNGLTTRVLGTKFTINDNTQTCTVEVVSGMVSVSTAGDSVILTRNQKADYSIEKKILTAAVIERPVPLNEQAFAPAFVDEPVTSVLKKIGDNYGLEITYDKTALGNRTFTADLSKTSLDEKLAIVCKAVNARYEINNRKIIIHPH